MESDSPLLGMILGFLVSFCTASEDLLIFRVNFEKESTFYKV